MNLRGGGVNCDAMSLAEASRNTKVSQFPVPVRPPRTRKRGAENNKRIFINKMDKVYFSIVKLSDILEKLEPTSPVVKLPYTVFRCVSISCFMQYTI